MLTDVFPLRVFQLYALERVTMFRDDLAALGITI